MSKLKSVKEILESIEGLDQNSINYYKGQYSKLKELQNVTIQVSDYDGNKTNFHSLNVESLLFLVELVQKMQPAEKVKKYKNIRQVWDDIRKGVKIYWSNKSYEVIPVSKGESDHWTEKNGFVLRVTCTSNYFGSLLCESEIGSLFSERDI